MVVELIIVLNLGFNEVSKELIELIKCRVDSDILVLQRSIRWMIVYRVLLFFMVEDGKSIIVGVCFNLSDVKMGSEGEQW